MAELLNIRDQRRKSIDVSDFFGEGAKIIIKKINRLVMNEINLLSQDTSIMKMAMAMLSENTNLSDADKKKKAIEFYSNLSSEEREKAANNSNKIEMLYINNGIEPNSHNITLDGKTVSIDYDFLIDYPEVIDFLLLQIKEYQEAVINTGEQNTSK